MSAKKEHPRTGESAHKGGAKPPTKEAAPETAGEAVEYVFTFHKHTGQIMKVEEVDPESGERKEVPTPPYQGYEGYAYDPYALYTTGYEVCGYDPYSGYGYGYDPYGGYGGA